ncbi:hypothetical protein ACVOMT_20950 (plasmid) [Sphingomonas panni]
MAILVIGFATVWLAGFPPRAIIPVIAVPMVIFAASGIADGWLSWRTGIDRAGQKLRKGGAPRSLDLGASPSVSPVSSSRRSGCWRLIQ